MSEELNKDVSTLSQDEKAAAWIGWVKDSVNKALDFYLERANTSNMNVKYIPAVLEVLETGPVYDSTKAAGVLLSVEILFDKPEEVKNIKE